MDEPMLLTDEMDSVRYSNSIFIVHMKGKIRRALFSGDECAVCHVPIVSQVWIVSRGEGRLSRHYYCIDCWNSHYVDGNGSPLLPLKIQHVEPSEAPGEHKQISYGVKGQKEELLIRAHTMFHYHRYQELECCLCSSPFRYEQPVISLYFYGADPADGKTRYVCIPCWQRTLAKLFPLCIEPR
jgi:hypothetical protein